VISFQIGDVVTNEELRLEYKCGNMGGMRRSRATNSLVLICDHTKSLYDDKWIEDILHYTGMGKTGDQSLSFMQNKTLAESRYNGVDVHLFEVFLPGQYVYQGLVELVGEPYQERQKDEDGASRLVWMFPLKRISEESGISEDLLDQNIERKEREARKLSLSELRERAEQNGSDKASSRSVTSNTYIRDAFVAEYAKRRANGVCQLCEEEAPFFDEQEVPFLETHHIVWLSRGGSDTIDNTVALCPNCHRKLHVLDLEEDRLKLQRVAQES